MQNPPATPPIPPRFAPLVSDLLLAGETIVWAVQPTRSRGEQRWQYAWYALGATALMANCITKGPFFFIYLAFSLVLHQKATWIFYRPLYLLTPLRLLVLRPRPFGSWAMQQYGRALLRKCSASERTVVLAREWVKASWVPVGIRGLDNAAEVAELMIRTASQPVNPASIDTSITDAPPTAEHAAHLRPHLADGESPRWTSPASAEHESSQGSAGALRMVAAFTGSAGVFWTGYVVFDSIPNVPTPVGLLPPLLLLILSAGYLWTTRGRLSDATYGVTDRRVMHVTPRLWSGVAVQSHAPTDDVPIRIWANRDRSGSIAFGFAQSAFRQHIARFDGVPDVVHSLKLITTIAAPPAAP